MKSIFFCLVFTLSVYGVIFKPSKLQVEERYEELCERLSKTTDYNISDPVIDNPLIVMLLLFLAQKATLEDFIALLRHTATDVNRQLRFEADFIVLENLNNVIIFNGDTVLHVLWRYTAFLAPEILESIRIELMARGARDDIQNITQLNPRAEGVFAMFRLDLNFEEHYNRWSDELLDERATELDAILNIIQVRLNVFSVEEREVFTRHRAIVNRILAQRFADRQTRLDAQRAQSDAVPLWVLLPAQNQTFAQPLRQDAPSLEPLVDTVILDEGCVENANIQ